MTATERAQLPAEELAAIQGQELNAVTTAYVVLGLVMLVLLLAIRLTKMPNLSEKVKNRVWCHSSSSYKE